MYFFALDSSGKAASAAISDGDRVISYGYLDLGLKHSETLMPLCDRVFGFAGLKPADIGCFAATIGPGSFTGLRIGVSIIKGMALAADKPCVGVPVNDALALSAEGFAGTALAVSDARGGRVFAAAYDMSGWPRRLCEDTTLEIERLTELMPDKKGSYIFVGDAAGLCYNAHKEAYGGLRFAQPQPPNAFCAVRCAVRMQAEGLSTGCRELNPKYLQPSQAERNLKK